MAGDASAVMTRERWHRATWAGFGAAATALLLRWLLIGDAAYTYNEATYVDLARHPTWTSFYPDRVFVRHPPLPFLLMAVWRWLWGDTEAVMRLASLIATLAGVGLLVDGMQRRRGPLAAWWVGAGLALAFPLHAYGLKASLYAYAFAAACLYVWGVLAKRPRWERIGLVAFCLSHLFGFVFLAFWALAHRSRLGDMVRVAALPAAWLMTSVVVAWLANTEGDIMRLGAAGQALRGGSNAHDAVTTRPIIQLAAGALALWSVNPALLWQLRRAWAAYWHWLAAAGLLLAAFFIMPPYPRYALLLVPFVVAACSIRSVTIRPGAAAAIAVVALLSLPAGSSYLVHGPDPRAAGDVPGLQEWDDATLLIPADAKLIATSGPTATAFYLMEDGHALTDRSEAPYRIRLAGDLEIVRLDAPRDIMEGPDAWMVPSHWDADAQLGAINATLCGRATGVDVYARSC